MSKLDTELKEIAGRVEKATPEPWHNRYNRLRVCDKHDNELAVLTNRHSGEPNHQGFENGDFIAHARQDIPRLLSLVGDLRQQASRCPWCSDYSLTVDVFDADDPGLEVRCQRKDCPSFGKDIATFGRELRAELATEREFRLAAENLIIDLKTTVDAFLGYASPNQITEKVDE